MTSETKRDRRRRDLQRMKAKALKVRPFKGAKAIKQAEHLAACSCWMCGNPRRYTGERTLQEQKAGIGRWGARSRVL